MRGQQTIAGGVLMTGLPGPELDAETSKQLQQVGPAGVILFSRNLVSPGQTIDLLREVRSLLPGPLLLAIDQEGGRVSRLEPWIGTTPSSARLARAGGKRVGRFARRTGEVLRALGFNLDFAPVVDLCAPDAGNGIDDRSFGVDPEAVTNAAGEFLDALQRTGVAGCLKHFPGLGDTVLDSHVALPTISRTREQLVAEDLEPYRRLAGRAACVMVGHGHYPALDPDVAIPASCSNSVVTGLLRDEIGYRGLIVSDDLLMGAVRERDRDGAAAVEALRAGCDLLLYCDETERALVASEALARAASDDRSSAERLREATLRVRATALRWPAPAPDPAAWTAARETFSEFA